MSLAVFLVIMGAALIHASWNAILKGGADKLLSTALLTSCSALIMLPFIFVLPIPARESWVYLLGSMVFQTAYLFLIVQAYRSADMSRAYPIMRGTAPVIVTFVSVVFMGHQLSLAAWAGIGVLSCGILLSAGLRQDRAALWALANSGMIAGYTLVDGVGVRLAGDTGSYIVWQGVMTAIPLLLFVLLTRSRAFFAYAKGNLISGFIGGLGAILSYGLALWAMTKVPVPVVSALRESSIFFALAISVLFLKERPSRQRLLGGCVIAAGAMVLRLA